ncbi:MAG TPA: hypothetical protein DCM87_14595, partial [Planctomycetes bacterium]|nr:hypothetical protein [Planctomycetota bacterium]
MANDRAPDSWSGSSGYREALVTQLVAGYVDRLNRGTEIDPEEIRREYPDLADEILSQLEVFVGIQAGVSGEGGRSVIGDYVLKRRVGRGGMGVVYDAWQTSLERRVALKVLPAGIAADGRVLQRFMREARTAAKLSHPHIVSVYGMGIEADTPYFAMEYVEGETLAQMIAARREAPKGETRDAVATPFGRASEGQLYYTRVAGAFAAVADALYHAHASGVVHRDIKPSNLIFDGESRLRILDFGLAHMEGQESLTHTGDFLGTPVYMSPEQAMAKRIPVDHRTDIYSLGATLYEVLCVRPPFQGKDVADTLSQIMLKEPRQLRDLDPRVPRDLETIVLKCLQKDPGDRYGTAEALAQDLRRFVRGEPIEARPQSAYERLTRSAWRHKGRLAVAAVTLLCVVTASLLGVSYARQLRAQKEARYAELVRDAVLKRELGRLTREGGGKRETDPFESMYDIRDSRAPLGMNLLQQARDSFGEAIALLPRRPEGYYHRAVANLLLERRDEAGRDITACLRWNPEFAAARGLRAAFPEAPAPGTAGLTIGDGESDASARAWLAAYKARREGRWQDAADSYARLIEGESPSQESFAGASIETRFGRGIANLVHGAYLDAYGDFAAAHALWPEAVEPEILRGKILLHMKEPERAARVFAGLWGRTLPNRDDVCAAVSCIYRFFQKPDEALVWADRVEDTGRRERNRTYCLVPMHRFDEAGEAYVKAIEATPGDPRNYGLHHSLIVLAETRGWREKIERLCLADIERNPDFAGAWTFLGIINESRGAWDKARELYEHALRLLPESNLAKFAYAKFIGERGEYARAIRLLEEVLDTGRDEAPYVMLGRMYTGSGKPRKACDLWRELVRINPAPWAKGQLAIGLALMGQRDEARALRDEILQTAAEDVDAMDFAAWTSLYLGEVDDAVSICRATIEMAPGQTHLREDLGYMYMMQARLADAARAYEEAEALEPGRNPGTYVYIENSYRRLGRHGEALAACRRGLEHWPGRADLWEHLEAMLVSMGRENEAFSSAVDFAKAIPEDPDAYAMLVDLDRAAERPEDLSHQWDDAIPALEQLRERHPDNRSLVNALALGYLRAETRRDVAKAREAIDAAGRVASHGDADVHATRAEVCFQEGKPAEAVAAIEEALALREDDPFLRVRHAAYAEALLPRFVSFASIDAVLSGRDREHDGALLDGFQVAAPGGKETHLRLYLEGRILGRAGAHADAARTFTKLIESGERSPRAILALAESLRAGGNAAEAERVLREALGAGARNDRACWNLWTRIGILDLGMSPADLAAGVPVSASTGDASTGDHGTDMCWLLGALASGAVRIDCG